MSTIFKDLEKQLSKSNCNHTKDTHEKYPHNIDIELYNLHRQKSIKPLTRCAIMILIFHKDGELCVLFTKRSMNMRTFPGEICFPGGKFDPQFDTTPEDTAIRETCEEIDLSIRNYRKLVQLCPFITINGHHVTATISLICHESQPSNGTDQFSETYQIVKDLKLNQDEVDSILWLPIKYFSQNLPSRSIENNIYNCIRIPFNKNLDIESFKKVLAPIPKFYTQVFIRLDDLNLIYGFNSFFILLILFLLSDDQDRLQLESDEFEFKVNKENIVEYINDMNKCSFIMYRKSIEKIITTNQNNSKL